MDDIRARLTVLEAREDIREVLYRYCRAADRRDLDLMKSCYHPEATDNHGFFSGSGWAFAEYVMPVLDQLELCVHSLSNPMIRIEGERAYVETQWTVIHRLRRWLRLTDLCHHGRYLDVFEQRNGEWKILHRIAVLDAERWVNTANLQHFIPDGHPHRQHQGMTGTGDWSYRLQRLADTPEDKTIIPEYSTRNGGVKTVWASLKLSLMLPVPVLHLLGRFIKRSGIDLSRFYA